MPELRELLTKHAGFEDVRTHLQSGNVVLSDDGPAANVRRECEHLIGERFGLDIRVVVRTRDELADVVERDPLREIAVDPKRYQVSFLAHAPDAETLARLEDAVIPPERFAVSGREIYTWYPGGSARSRLSALLGGTRLGVDATSRNWTTVTKLLALAED